jgi:transposase
LRSTKVINALRKQGPHKEQPAMTYGAIDLHARYSQIRVLAADGRVLRDQKVATTAERLVTAFAPYGGTRILLESSTESEWVAQALEAAGHTVIVADPNFAPMYGEVRRTVKTDRRDAAALAEANRRGWFRPVHRVSAAQRARRQVLRTRRHLVQMRSGTISLIRTLLRQDGYRLPRCSAGAVADRVGTLAVAAGLQATLEPLLRVFRLVSEEITTLDRQAAATATADPIVRRLMTAPGIGAIVGLTFRAFVDDVARFSTAGQVSAAIGLVPREDSSAERRHRGHITKAGPRELRSLLVQAAWVCWRRATGTGTLKAWTDRLAARRGKRIAVVALARRLSRILYALWRDEVDFNAATLAA